MERLTEAHVLLLPRSRGQRVVHRRVPHASRVVLFQERSQGMYEILPYEEDGECITLCGAFRTHHRDLAVAVFNACIQAGASALLQPPRYYAVQIVVGDCPPLAVRVIAPTPDEAIHLALSSIRSLPWFSPSVSFSSGLRILSVMISDDAQVHLYPATL